jgi:small conductance mechanosensitive channel
MNWEKTFETIMPQLIAFAARAAWVLVLLFIAWLVAGWLQRIVLRATDRARLDATLAKFLARFVRWLVVLLAVLACLGVFGVETTSFAAVIGSVGLAIGLAFQGTLSNIASGVMLLVFRPFKVGDTINAGGELGKVDEIELFTTTLDTPDNRRIIIPNSKIFGSTIENINYHSRRRADISVGVAYDADIDHTREVLLAAIAGVPDALTDPAPVVVLLDLGASSVDWSVRVWASSAKFGDVKQAAIRAVKRALDAAAIGIPFPQMDVHLDQPAAS